MTYTGLRRPSVADRLGAYASWTLAVILLAELFIFASRNNRDSVPVVAAAFALSLVVSVVLHEGGHLVAGLMFGEPVRKLRIGSGPTLIGFRVRGLVIQVCLNPLSGGAVYYSTQGLRPGARRLLSIAAGPAVNAFVSVIAFSLYQNGLSWLGIFVVANAALFIATAMPTTSVEGGRKRASDGMQILNLLLRRPTLHTHFDGIDLSADARAVLVRAMEDAQISAETEITDMHLLRALAQDANLSPLFKSVGLDRRIPPSAIPQSDALTVPHWARGTDPMLGLAERLSRDVGNSRPNAAGLCLGLLGSDCPAGKLMKEAGLTEESLRVLAAVEKEDDESQLRRQVISPDVPLERWGTAADQALARAFVIAAADRSLYVGTQHILAALVADSACRAAQALTRARFALVATPNASNADPTKPQTAPELSPQAALAVAGALWRTGASSAAGTAELCLGIIDHSAGIGAQILESAGITAETLINALRVTQPEQSQSAGCTAPILALWARRGSARVGVQRWMDARSDFLVAESKAVRDWQHAIFRNNIAWVSLMSSDSSLAPDALAKSSAAIAFKSDQPAFVGTHALALLRNGSPAEAAALLEPFAPKTTRPRDRANQECVLAMCYARLGRREEAARKIDSARAADPTCALLPRAEMELESTSRAIASVG